MRMATIALAFGAMAALSACDDAAEIAAPNPVPITRAATGHYCRMIVVDHKGPKGQIHIAGRKAPVWFSSVRDTIAFTMLPEETKRITAIYVNDMSKTNWERPGATTWIDARTALFVIGSSKRGGMGAAEAVPFKGKAAAEAFAKRHGGRVVAYKQIPRDYILGEAGTAPSYGGGGGGHSGHGAKSHESGVLEAGGSKSKAKKPMTAMPPKMNKTPMKHGEHGKPEKDGKADGGHKH